ncbi:hypothetical protein POM88_040472 [Heracleum sosnowskyi]|uniref:Transposase-associated domain-containing protein n=1 Tax=Heracleum sosnowskyi TaxID=360622 RepID=A0AAD8HDA3_9APIA|nr:hypothetical protein POM88_040472 [Heracleum sosnowskyi]
MASDRSWIHHRFDARNNITEEYKLGVQNFISVALRGEVGSKGRIRCPCKECGNSWSKLPDNVTYDLYRYGIMESYTTWIFHGEKHRSWVEAETSSEVYTYPVKPILRKGHRILSVDEHRLIKYYVLINTPEVVKFLGEFHKLVHRQYPEFDDEAKERFQKDRFTNWFERRVVDDSKLQHTFNDLIRGPMRDVVMYNGCYSNGYKFGCTNPNERTSPNSSVVVIGPSYKDSFENNYGRLEEKNSISNDGAMQNEVSNATSSHVEPVIINDARIFFIDLRFVENDNSVHDYIEEQNDDNDEVMNDVEESESDDDMS